MKIVYAFGFILFYLWEIVISTFRIGLMVVSPRLSLQPEFVEVEMDLKGDLPRFLFACLISMTPGSLSVGMDATRGVLLVHLIDAPDTDAAIAEMKENFEKPLIRIFGKAD